MTDREKCFAALTAVSMLLMIAGTAWFSTGAALILAGPLLALWSWFVLAEGDSDEVNL